MLKTRHFQMSFKLGTADRTGHLQILTCLNIIIIQLFSFALHPKNLGRSSVKHCLSYMLEMDKTVKYLLSWRCYIPIILNFSASIVASIKLFVTVASVLDNSFSGKKKALQQQNNRSSTLTTSWVWAYVPSRSILKAMKHNLKLNGIICHYLLPWKGIPVQFFLLFFVGK